MAVDSLNRTPSPGPDTPEDQCDICFERTPPLFSVSGPDHPENLSHKYHRRCLDIWLTTTATVRLPLSPACIRCTRSITHIGGEPFTNHHRGVAVVQAAENNNLDVVNARLAEGPIPDEYRDYAIAWAAGNNNLAMVNALLANGRISDEHRGFAVKCAATYNNLAMVNALLENGRISDEDRGIAVTWVAGENNFAAVNALLANGPISDEHRGITIGLAAEHNNLAMVDALLANGPISDEYRGIAVGWAASENNLAVVSALLASGPISIGHGYRAARQSTNPRIVLGLVRSFATNRISTVAAIGMAIVAVYLAR